MDLLAVPVNRFGAFSAMPSMTGWLSLQMNGLLLWLNLRDAIGERFDLDIHRPQRRAVASDAHFDRTSPVMEGAE